MPDASGKPLPCALCGGPADYATPDEAGDDEGFHYFTCKNAINDACTQDSSWGESKSKALSRWNEDQRRAKQKDESEATTDA